jgi:hypothetical protein
LNKDAPGLVALFHFAIAEQAAKAIQLVGRFSTAGGSTLMLSDI